MVSSTALSAVCALHSPFILFHSFHSNFHSSPHCILSVTSPIVIHFSVDQTYSYATGLYSTMGPTRLCRVTLLLLISVGFLFVSGISAKTITCSRSQPRSDVSVTSGDVTLNLQLSATPSIPTIFRAVCRVGANEIPKSTLVETDGIVFSKVNNVIVPAAVDITINSGTTAAIIFSPSPSFAETPVCVFSFVSGDAAFTDAIVTVLVEVNPPTLGLGGFDTVDGLKLDVGFLPTLTVYSAVLVSKLTQFQVLCTNPVDNTIWFQGVVNIPTGGSSCPFTFTTVPSVELGDQICSVTALSGGDSRLTDSSLTVNFDFVIPRVSRNYFGKYGWCDEVLKGVSGDTHDIILTSTSTVQVDTIVTATCVPLPAYIGVNNIFATGTFFTGSNTAIVTLESPYLVENPSVTFQCTFSSTGDARMTSAVSSVQYLEWLVELGEIRSVKPVSGATGIIVVQSLQTELFTVGLAHTVISPGVTFKTVCIVNVSNVSVEAGTLTLAEFREDTFQSTFAFTSTTVALEGLYHCRIAFLSTAAGSILDKSVDDIRFKEAYATFDIMVVANTLIFTSDKSSYQPTDVGTLTLTANELFLQDTDVTITCPGAGVFSQACFHFVAGGSLQPTISFTASAIAGTHPCTFVVLASTLVGDVRYSGVTVTGSLQIVIAAPKLTFSYCDFNQLNAGNTQYFSLGASIVPTGDIEAELRCIFTPPAVQGVPSLPLYATAYFHILPGTSQSVSIPEYLTSIKVPNGFFGQASCTAIVTEALDARFNTSLFYNGPTLMANPTIWTVSLPKFELIGVNDGDYIPAGTTQTLTLMVHDPDTNTPFVVPTGGQITLTGQCVVTDPADPGYGVVTDNFIPNTGIIPFTILEGKSSGDAVLTLPSLLDTGLPAEVRCVFDNSPPAWPDASAAVATGMGNVLNMKYTYDFNGVSGSVDAALAVFRFFIVPPTLILSTDLDVLPIPQTESGANVEFTVTIADGVAAVDDVLVPIKCDVVGLPLKSFTADVLITALSTHGTVTIRTHTIGVHKCYIWSTVTDIDGNALIDSRLQFAGPEVVLGEIASVSFSTVAAQLTLVAGIKNSVDLALNIPVQVSLSSSIVTDGVNDVLVTLTCGGTDIQFHFLGVPATSTGMNMYTPPIAQAATCILKAVVSNDPSFVDIQLNAVHYTIFNPSIIFNGLNDGLELFTDNAVDLKLTTNEPIVGVNGMDVQLVCSSTSPDYADTTFTFHFAEGAIQANALTQFIAPTVSVSTIVCDFSFVGGDVRYRAVTNSLANISVSVTEAWTSVTKTAGTVTAGSTITLTLSLSTPVLPTKSLIISAQCSPTGGLLSDSGLFHVSSSLTSATLSYQTPSIAGEITCLFHFVSGDDRFTTEEPSDIVFTTIAATSSGTSGDNLSGGSTGLDDGNHLDVNSPSQSSGLSTGATTGIAVGIVCGVIIIAGLVYFGTQGIGGASSAAAAGNLTAAVPVQAEAAATVAPIVGSDAPAAVPPIPVGVDPAHVAAGSAIQSAVSHGGFNMV
jgi:hypothetical protein